MPISIHARASDAVIARCADAAISELTTLIAEAVRSSDDRRVASLDSILRQVETIMESRGSVANRRAFPSPMRAAASRAVG